MSATKKYKINIEISFEAFNRIQAQHIFNLTTTQVRQSLTGGPLKGADVYSTLNEA